MKSLLIDPEHGSVTETFYDGQLHSLYTLFASLLVDSHDILNRHTVYAAREGFEKGRRAFILGEKLLFGPVLVTGKEGFEDADALITTAELAQLAQFELPGFYREVLARLPKAFNFEERIRIEAGETIENVLPEWIIYAYNMADTGTRQYFLNTLESTKVKGESLDAFFKRMGEIALRSMG